MDRPAVAEQMSGVAAAVARRAATVSEDVQAEESLGCPVGYAAMRASWSVSSRISTAIFVRADAYCRL
jgi:hypothetical protein